MRIQFISQNVENVPTANGGYNKMSVTFKNLENNKVEVKQVMDFASPNVYKRLVEAKTNDLFSIDLEKKPGKDGKSYWTWTDIHRDDGTAPAPVETPVATTAAKGGTWDEKNKLDRERFDFEKDKQALIIRQSCLSNAVLFVKDQGKKPTVAEVLELSAQFENYVWAKGIAGMTDDVPV
jgi:hypothetical protein